MAVTPGLRDDYSGRWFITCQRRRLGLLPGLDVAGCGGYVRCLSAGWRRSSAVEQGNHNPLVGGSNPSAATIGVEGLAPGWGNVCRCGIFLLAGI
jgi:hypothetical protein